MSMTSRLRRWGERFGLLLFGLCLALALLEGGIRLAALFVGPRAYEAGGGGKLTLLTLGDSHTYGVFYTAEEAYPGQLAAVLEQRAPGRYRVVNLGLPGMNSAEIVARMPAWYARFRPRAAIVCVGVNNVWNLSDTEPDHPEGDAGQWLSSLRIVRLGRILRANLESHPSPPEDTGRPQLKRVLIAKGTQGAEHRDAVTGEVLIRHRGNIRQRAITLAEGAERLRQDLEKMREISEEWGVGLVLLTYAAFPLPGRESLHALPQLMSEQMREISRQRGLALVDVHDLFAALLADGGPRSRYFRHDTEAHPNPRGYAEIAALVADQFEPR